MAALDNAITGDLLPVSPFPRAKSTSGGLVVYVVIPTASDQQVAQVATDAALAAIAGPLAGKANAGDNGDIARLLGVGGAGIDFLASSTTVASAATVDLGALTTRKVQITGTASISSFGTQPHRERLIHFTGACTLVHNATSLMLPGGASIVTAAGDTAVATSDASGNWRVRDYARASGKSLVGTTAAELGLTSPSYRNRIINGGFTINQRLIGSGSQSYAAGTYLFDRWKAGSAGVTLSYAITASGVVVTISTGSLVQIIEGAVYLTEGGAYVLSWTGTAQGRIYQGATVPYAAGPILVSLGAANTTIEFGVGTLSLVQFEPGTVPTLFERRDDERQRCLRYYQPLGNWTGAVQENSGTTVFIYGKYGTMRTTPTAALVAPSSYLGRPNVTAITPTAIGITGLTTEGGYIALSVPTQTVGVFVGVNNPTGIMLSAEL